MSDQLNFGDGSWDQAKGTIFTTLQGLKSDMDGNGKPGLKDDMQSVRTDLSEIKAYGRASAFWGRFIAPGVSVHKNSQNSRNPICVIFTPV